MGLKIRLPGLAGAIFNDRETWDPVIPADMNSSRLPPVDPDGTVPCGSCGQRFLVGAMNLTEDGYACAQCSRLRAANAGSSGAALASVSLTDRSWVKPALGVAAVVVVIAIIVAAS